MFPQPTSGRELPGPAGQLLEQVRQALLASAPQGWQQIEIKCTASVVVQQFELALRLVDGGTPPMSVPAEIKELLSALRGLMYEPGRGTWFSATLLLEEPGHLHVDFNLDDDPEWWPSVTPDVFARDLEAFPRRREHVPAWLRDLLAADPHLQDASTAPRRNLPMAANRLSPVEQDERLQTITRLLIEALPSDWRKAAIVFRSVGRHAEYAASIRVGDGPMELWAPPEEVWTPFVDLRWGMYIEGIGTWNSARFDLDHPDRYSIRYDRGEPTWATPPPREEVDNERKFFPRTEPNTPDWLR